jgi:hypothetical protein
MRILGSSTLLLVLLGVCADSANAQRVVMTSSFTNDQGLKDAVGDLLSTLQPRGIVTTDLSNALGQSVFHRDITETAGVNFGLSASTGITLLPHDLKYMGKVCFVFVNDSNTHTILSSSDSNELINHQFGTPIASTGGFQLAGSASTAVHELMHSLIYRTGCFKGSVLDIKHVAEENLVEDLEAAIASKVIGARNTFIADMSTAQAAGGTACMELLGLFNPISRFTMTAGTQSAVEGQSLVLTVPEEATANVAFSAARSSDLDGTIAAWEWNIDGTLVSNASSFTRALGVGESVVTLIVTDNQGYQSQPVNGTVVITTEPPPAITGYLWQPVPTASGAVFAGGRQGFDIAHDTQRGQTVLFGGIDNLGSIYSDTWIWDGVDWARVYPSQSPEYRWGHAMAYDEERKVVVLFGGTSNYGNFWGDTWLWNGTTWTNVPVVGPGPRFAHTMVYDKARGKVVLYGGMSADLVPQNDLWTWDGSQWTRISTDGAPPPRGSSKIAYDEVRSQIVLFGGGNPLTGEAFTDTWVFDQNNAWTQRTPANSPGQIAAYYQTVAFDPRIGRVILFGFGNLRSETWSWDGVNWCDLTMDPILSGLGHMVFESSRGQMLLVGGSIGVNVGGAVLRQ